MNLRVLGGLLLVGSAIGCAHPRPRAMPPRPRGWIEVSGGIADLQSPRNDVVGDALVLGLGGGLDFLRGAQDLGFELGVVGSEHELDPDYVDFGEDDYDVNVFRFHGGARATTELGALPFTVYVRGGWFFRSEFDESHNGLGEDGWGTYVGGGLEYMVEPDIRFGPFVTFQRGAEDGLEEWLFGFSARFYVDE
ncbi:MAG: hypothetical protein HZA52_12520 [Planctomycetes bacterium]|nr:hypothetical protein [Planctomycetota bacterium]